MGVVCLYSVRVCDVLCLVSWMMGEEGEEGERKKMSFYRTKEREERYSPFVSSFRSRFVSETATAASAATTSLNSAFDSKAHKRPKLT